MLPQTLVLSRIGHTCRDTCERDFGVYKEHSGKISREAQERSCFAVTEKPLLGMRARISANGCSV